MSGASHNLPGGSAFVARREQFLTVRQGPARQNDGPQPVGHSVHVARYGVPDGRYRFHSSRLRFRPTIAQARRRQTAGSTSHSVARVGTPATASSLPSGLNEFRSPINGTSKDGWSEAGTAVPTSSSP